MSANSLVSSPSVAQPCESRVTPFIGTFFEYLFSSIRYMFDKKSYVNRADKVFKSSSKNKLSRSFLTAACLFLGFISNVKFEVVLLDGVPLSNDLHYLVSSIDENLYIDDIDPEKVLWCVEASDCFVLVLSTILLWFGSELGTALSVYLFIPWLGVTIRGLLVRQLPTVAALIYTESTIDGEIDMTFLAAYSLLFLIQLNLCVQIVRILRSRWDTITNKLFLMNNDPDLAVKFGIDQDVMSIEMSNQFY